MFILRSEDLIRLDTGPGRHGRTNRRHLMRGNTMAQMSQASSTGEGRPGTEPTLSLSFLQASLLNRVCAGSSPRGTDCRGSPDSGGPAACQPRAPTTASRAVFPPRHQQWHPACPRPRAPRERVRDAASGADAAVGSGRLQGQLRLLLRVGLEIQHWQHEDEHDRAASDQHAKIGVPAVLVHNVGQRHASIRSACIPAKTPFVVPPYKSFSMIIYFINKTYSLILIG
jgi:hypothetical protein